MSLGILKLNFNKKEILTSNFLTFNKSVVYLVQVEEKKHWI